jgi:hypothetical protein
MLAGIKTPSDRGLLSAPQELDGAVQFDYDNFRVTSLKNIRCSIDPVHIWE